METSMKILLLNNLLDIMKYITIYSLIFHGKIYKNKASVVKAFILTAFLFMQTFILQSGSLIILVFISCLILLCLYEGKYKNKIILFLLTWISVNYLDTICYLFLGGAIRDNVVWYYSHAPVNIKLIENIVAEFIILLVAWIYTRNNHKRWFEAKLNIRQCILLLGAMLGLYIVFITFILFMAYGAPDKRNLLNIILIASAIITISCILAFFLYSNHLKKENDLKTKNIEVQEENDGLRLALYANMEMMDDDMRQYRHDNRHHRAVLRELASKGDLEEIKDYLVQLSEQDEDLKKKNVLYTGNYMVDAIINGIIAKEAYSDVKFHCEGKLPRKLMIQDVDLSGLLSNGLENAAEACLHSNGDKCVLFKAVSYENMIHFEIKNTYDSTRYKALSKGDFETTKKDSEYHGYGIESMRRIVKKYDGKLEYIVEPEWVITDIYLQQKDEI